VGGSVAHAASVAGGRRRGVRVLDAARSALVFGRRGW
jgi:hypothetical protein